LLLLAQPNPPGILRSALVASAVDILHYFKPLEHLDQAIYRDILKGSRQDEEFALNRVDVEKREATLVYDVLRLPRRESHGEIASLGVLTTTSLLFLRAAVTGKPHHWTGAICAGAVALIGGEETIRKAQSAFHRLSKAGKLGQVSLKLTPGEAVVTYRVQQVQMSLAPMRQLVVRAFKRNQTSQSADLTYGVHIDLQDGRVISLHRTGGPVEARRLGRQVAGALQLPMVFQSIDVSEVQNGYSWEMGPQLIEPALN
jgi:hypothetical protein